LFKNLDNILINPDVTIKEAMMAINQGAVGVALIASLNCEFIDVVTDGDIRRFLLKGGDIHDSLENLYKFEAGPRSEPIVASDKATNQEIIRLMKEKRIRHIPIIDRDGKIVDLALLGNLVNTVESSLSAVVMAGGYGTRLRPLTLDLPKPMLPVGGRPLLELIVDKLKLGGISRIHITTCFEPEKIKEYFGDGSRFGVEFEYVDENKPLGTAGSLGLMEKPDRTQLVMNGDILTQLNLNAMLDFHRDNRADITLAVRKYDIEVPYGVVETEGIHTHKLSEKPTYAFFVNAGIYLLEPVCYEYIPKNMHFDMTDLIDRMLSEKRTVISFPVEEYWLDIGRPEDYKRAQIDLMEGKLYPLHGRI
jgi:dTDP-glucose pyrophosphorylase/CBS domain-containing protein